jgi:hypothetical protein
LHEGICIFTNTATFFKILIGYVKYGYEDCWLDNDLLKFSNPKLNNIMKI